MGSLYGSSTKHYITGLCESDWAGCSKSSKSTEAYILSMTGVLSHGVKRNRVLWPSRPSKGNMYRVSILLRRASGYQMYFAQCLVMKTELLRHLHVNQGSISLEKICLSMLTISILTFDTAFSAMLWLKKMTA